MNVPGAVDQGPAVHCLLLHPLGRRADRQRECEISPTLPTDTSGFLNRSDPWEWRQLSPGSWSFPLLADGDTGAKNWGVMWAPAVGEHSDYWSHFRLGPLPDEQRNLSHHKAFRGEHWGHCECSSQVAQPALLLQQVFLNTSSSSLHQQQLPTCASGFFQLAQPKTTLSQILYRNFFSGVRKAL